MLEAFKIMRITLNLMLRHTTLIVAGMLGRRKAILVEAFKADKEEGFAADTRAKRVVRAGIDGLADVLDTLQIA